VIIRGAIASILLKGKTSNKAVIIHGAIASIVINSETSNKAVILYGAIASILLKMETSQLGSLRAQNSHSLHWVHATTLVHPI